MSLLSLSMRPLTVFEASNDEHRTYYAEFVKVQEVKDYCADNHPKDVIKIIYKEVYNYFEEENCE